MYIVHIDLMMFVVLDTGTHPKWREMYVVLDTKPYSLASEGSEVILLLV